VRVIAIDWSGAQTGAERRIWRAEASSSGLTHLECGRSRSQVLADLLDVPPRTVIGLDFAFSFPAWFLDELRLGSAAELWAYAAEHGERWLAECAPPFWGRPGKPRPVRVEHFRRTEHELRARGVHPKSVFQIGGAGAVGTGSIRGMPLLHVLHERGFSIWPFDPPGWPLVLEIYPRMLTGSVTKSSALARQSYLAQHYPGLECETEDAFDAAVSALVMACHASELAALPEASDAQVRREGWIWAPGLTALPPLGTLDSWPSPLLPARSP
jgi:hypothetical protein